MITAIASTFNNASVISDFLDSVFEQSLKDFKIVIINDGSTDKTGSILEKVKDPRLVYTELPQNQGVGSALNFALPLITSPFFIKVDCDDICHKERFEASLNYLQEHPNIDFLKGLFFHFPDTEEVRHSERFKWLKSVKEAEINALEDQRDIQAELPDWCCISHNTFAGKSEILKSMRYPRLRMGEDYELFLSLLAKGARFGHCSSAITYMRVSDQSTVGSGSFHADYYEMLLRMKADRLLDFLGPHTHSVTIIGKGKLAKCFGDWLESRAQSQVRLIDLFLESNQIKLGAELSDSNRVSASEVAHRVSEGEKVLVACQPVRSRVISLLEASGLLRNIHFMVVA